MSSCKFSTLKSIRVIAFIDLIDAVIFAVYRGIYLSMLLARLPTNETRARASQHNKSSQIESDKRSTPVNMNGTYMKYWSVILLTAIVIAFAIEVFLFLLLNSGAPMRNLRHCKHWFFVRVFLLVFSITGSVIDLLLGEYTLTCGLLEVEKLYRLATLYIMWRFMDEIKAGDFDSSKLNCGTEAGSSNVFGSFSNAQ